MSDEAISLTPTILEIASPARVGIAMISLLDFLNSPFRLTKR